VRWERVVRDTASATTACSEAVSAHVVLTSRVAPATRASCIPVSTVRRGLFLPARRYAIAGTSHGPASVCLCLYLCLLQIGVLSKRLNESSWFWHGIFLPPILHCVKRKFGYLQKYGYFPLEIYPKLRT